MSKKINAIDIEASALFNGYPIQIGIIKKNGEQYSKYIKPHEDWINELYWDFNSECIHGIEENYLINEGSSISLVAKELNNFLKEEIVYCDSIYDIDWINLLYEYAEIKKTFSVRLIFKDFNVIDNWEEYFHKTKIDLKLQQHDALNDSKIIQETFERISKN